MTIINRLLASFPSSAAGQGDDTLDGYLIGTRDVPVDFLALAAQRFLSGSVPGQHMTFPPTPAQLANEARDHWYRHLDAVREERRRLAPPEPEDHVITDEERARGIAAFERIKASLAASMRTDEADRDARRRERGEQEIKRLVERGDLVEVKGGTVPVSRSLMRQYGVGDPEGDRDVA